MVIALLVAAGALLAPSHLARRSVGRGTEALRLYKFDAARDHFHRAAEWHGLGGEVALLQARTAWMDGRIQDATNLLDEAETEGFPKPRIELERQLIAARGGKSAAMRSRLPGQLQRFSEDGPAILQAYTIGYLAAGDVGGATEVTSAWRDAAPEDARVDYWLGIIDQTFGHADEAIDHFRVSLRRAPGMTTARAALAGILQAQLYYREASELYAQTLETDPTDRDALVGLATCQLHFAPEKGQAMLADVVAQFPDQTEARIALAEHHLNQGRPGETLRLIEPLLSAPFTDLTLCYVAAATHAALGDDEASNEWFDRFRQGNHQFENAQMWKVEFERRPSPELARQIATTLMECRWREAGPWILTTLALAPQDAEAHQMMSEFMKRSGRMDESEAFAVRAGQLAAP